MPRGEGEGKASTALPAPCLRHVCACLRIHRGAPSQPALYMSTHAHAHT